MKLTDEQKKALFEKVKVGCCPNCGSKGKRQALDSEFLLMSPNRDGRDVMLDVCGHGIPLVATMCLDCGYLSLFNAIHLGLSKQI